MWSGAGIPNNLGLQALLLSNASPWGVTDPIHAHDVSFYVFQLPVLLSFLMFALILNFLVISIVIAGYAATGAIRWSGGNFYAENRARVHQAILLAFFMGLMGVRFWAGGDAKMIEFARSPIYAHNSSVSVHARIMAI